MVKILKSALVFALFFSSISHATMSFKERQKYYEKPQKKNEEENKIKPVKKEESKKKIELFEIKKEESKESIAGTAEAAWKEYQNKYPLHALIKKEGNIAFGNELKKVFDFIEKAGNMIIQRDNNGMWAIEYSKKNDVKNYLGERMLLELATLNKTDDVEKLLKVVKDIKNFNINLADDFLFTAMNHAINHGNDKMIDILLNHGATYPTED
jgi:hypothetical protein